MCKNIFFSGPCSVAQKLGGGTTLVAVQVPPPQFADSPFFISSPLFSKKTGGGDYTFF